MKKGHILICGPVAPPIGGVAVHIARLARVGRKVGFAISHCDESRILKDEVFNLREFDLFGYIKLFRSADLVHIHSSVDLFRLFHLAFALIFRKPIIITFHSWRGGRLQTFFTSRVIGFNGWQCIFVSERVKNLINLPGVVIPAFIPPDLDDETDLPIDILDWVNNQRQQGRHVLSSNAFRLDFLDGKDIYGLDICMDAFLDPWVAKNCSMLFVVSSLESPVVYINTIKKKLNSRGLSAIFYLRIGAISYPKLIKVVDATVRATTTDGDAISVRESLYFNKITIASDVVVRPNGTVLFKTSDSFSLALNMQQAFEVKFDAAVPSGPSVDFYKDIEMLYASALSSSAGN